MESVHAGLGDDELASALAAAAGQRLLALRAAGVGPGLEYPDASALRKAADLNSHDFLAAELATLRPGDAVLSEEAKDDHARLRASRVWIVDPLDGTREFGEPGRTDWAVHVALWEGGALRAGAVALPARDRLFGTTDPVELPADRPGRPLRLVVSRTRPPAFLQAMAGELGAELIGMGSAGAKTAAVLSGEADAYVHSGGQYEWDSAAPVAVARKAGLHASRIDGSELVYNQASPWVPDILICLSALADRLLRVIAYAQSAVSEEPEGIAPHRLRSSS